MSNKEKKIVKGILGVRKSPHRQVLLFGRYADPLPSDDSDDSDYEPVEEEDEKNTEKLSLKNRDFVQAKRKKERQGRVREEEEKQAPSGVDSKRRKTNSPDVLESRFVTAANAWSDLIPSEVLLQIFLYCVETQGAVPLLSRFVVFSSFTARSMFPLPPVNQYLSRALAFGWLCMGHVPCSSVSQTLHQPMASVAQCSMFLVL